MTISRLTQLFNQITLIKAFEYVYKLFMELKSKSFSYENSLIFVGMKQHIVWKSIEYCIYIVYSLSERVLIVYTYKYNYKHLFLILF